MSLRDDLESIQMNQTRAYRDEEPGSPPTNNSNNSSTTSQPNQGSQSQSEREGAPNPFRNEDGSSTFSLNKKTIMFGGGAILVIILVVVFYFGFNSINSDQGAGFLQELEDGSIPSFQYSMEERELLRTNGFTADDIERYQVEERDPTVLVSEAKEARQRLYDEEVKPLLDGASPAYKELESMTWLGTGEMDPVILSNQEGSYEEWYGTYNCDYIKVKPMGSQLFIKLDLAEFDESIFMTVTPKRYNELSQSGNIVVVIEFNKYSNNSILVTGVQEKDIKN
jgi:hypothetical protein